MNPDTAQINEIRSESSISIETLDFQDQFL